MTKTRRVLWCVAIGEDYWQPEIPGYRLQEQTACNPNSQDCLLTWYEGTYEVVAPVSDEQLRRDFYEACMSITQGHIPPGKWSVDLPAQADMPAVRVKETAAEPKPNPFYKSK